MCVPVQRLAVFCPPHTSIMRLNLADRAAGRAALVAHGQHACLKPRIALCRSAPALLT
jgi:hypothetical protein